MENHVTSGKFGLEGLKFNPLIYLSLACASTVRILIFVLQKAGNLFKIFRPIS